MWIYVWVLVLVVLFFPKLITCLRFPTFAMFKLGGGMEVCLNVNCPSVNFCNNFDPILKDPLWKAWTTRSCHFCSVSYFPHWNLFFDFWLLAGWQTRLTRWKLSLGPISRIFSGETILSSGDIIFSRLGQLWWIIFYFYFSANNAGVFVDFFAPWFVLFPIIPHHTYWSWIWSFFKVPAMFFLRCPPCMGLLPEFRKASTLIGGQITFGTVSHRHCQL